MGLWNLARQKLNCFQSEMIPRAKLEAHATLGMMQKGGKMALLSFCTNVVFFYF